MCTLDGGELDCCVIAGGFPVCYSPQGSHIQKILSAFQQLTSSKSSGLILLPENYKFLNVFFLPCSFFLVLNDRTWNENLPPLSCSQLGTRLRRVRWGCLILLLSLGTFHLMGSIKYSLGRKGLLVKLMRRAVLVVIAAEPESGTTVSPSCGEGCLTSCCTRV